MTGQRIISLLIFFFFLFDGFQFIPVEWFETPFGFSKSLDFAFLYVFVLFVWGCIYYKDFIPHNKLTLWILGYLGMIIILMGISKFVYGIGLGDIIRTGRFFFLVLAYFIMRRCTIEEIDIVLKVCIFVVVFQSVLFIIQGFTGISMLQGAEDNFERSKKLITRYYNMPKMSFFFAFYVFFGKPFKNWINILFGVIILGAIFVPLHRSLSIIVILLFGLGIILSLKNIKQFIKYLPYIAIIVIPLVVILMAQVSSRTLNDIQSVRNGDFIDIEDIDLDQESTFLFRIAHFYERYIFAQENPMYRLFGMGFMTEESSYTANNFDFIIGLGNDQTGNITQLDTSDISWSLFVIRYGYIGTIVYLAFFSFILYYYWKRREEGYALAIFLYMLVGLGCSLTSDMLFNIVKLIFPLLFFEITQNKEIDKKIEDEVQYNNTSI